MVLELVSYERNICESIEKGEVYHYLLFFTAEAAKRLKIMETDTKEKLVPKLRIESRRKYLEKRKEDKVAELEADILDDEYLFEEEM